MTATSPRSAAGGLIGLLTALCAAMVLAACVPPWAGPRPTPPDRWPQAARGEGFEEAVLVGRLHGGDLTVRRVDGSQWVLSPVRSCPWCWMSTGRRVYLKFGPTSSVLVSESGETADCWTQGSVGGPRPRARER